MKQYSPEALNLLNAIADATGITDKSTVISLAISMIVKETGVEIRVAFELVFGADSWDAMLIEVYEALRAKAAQAEFKGTDEDGFAVYHNVKL